MTLRPPQRATYVACPVGRRELEKHRMSNPVRFVLAVLCVAALFYLVIALARGMAA